MISRLGRAVIIVVPNVAGYGGYHLSSFLPAGRVSALVSVVTASCFSYVGLVAIRAALDWIARQDPPDSDMPLADPKRIIGHWRYLPVAVFVAAAVHAVLSS